MTVHKFMVQIHPTLEGSAQQPERHLSKPLTPSLPSATAWTATFIPT